MEVEDILIKVREGTMEISEAASRLRTKNILDLGFAKLDLGRRMRQGCAEVVFCQGKSDEHLVQIFQSIFATEGEVLGTRATKEQYELIRRELPQVVFDDKCGILKIVKESRKSRGLVAVCSAGTADYRAAEECAQTAEFFGSYVKRFYDVGISGIHRLFEALPEIEKANVIVAAAGMEGALGTVIGGLVLSPVICVPTSVGYGASFQGLSALLTMLNSCANGVCTVNIDNGYGAGYLAHQINRQSKNF